jgi:hypothetical protein
LSYLLDLHSHGRGQWFDRTTAHQKSKAYRTLGVRVSPIGMASALWSLLPYAGIRSISTAVQSTSTGLKAAALPPTRFEALSCERFASCAVITRGLLSLYLRAGRAHDRCGFPAHLVRSAGEEGRFSFQVHPHMLRHAFGFYLVNKGFDTRAIQAYLGHRNIQHTVRYIFLG